MPDGSRFYGEQTSHHPPITNFLLEGPNNLYRFSGFFEYKAWLSGINSLGGSRVGKQIFSFNDGGLLSIKDPTMQITGLVSGERALNFVGTMSIVDHINKLELIVTYNPPKEGQSSGMFKSIKNKLWSGKKKEEQLSDAVLIQIFQKALNGNSKEKVLVAEGSGSWLEYIQFDGKVYWTALDERPKWIMVNDKESCPDHLQDMLLPSDS
jgi:Oxysterol-binding protein